MNDDPATRAQKRAQELYDAVPRPPALPTDIENAWKALTPDDDVIMPKGAFTAIISALERMPLLAINACNVALALSKNDNENGIKTFEDLVRSSVELQALLEGAVNNVKRTTVEQESSRG